MGRYKHPNTPWTHLRMNGCKRRLHRSGLNALPFWLSPSSAHVELSEGWRITLHDGRPKLPRYEYLRHPLLRKTPANTLRVWFAVTTLHDGRIPFCDIGSRPIRIRDLRAFFLKSASMRVTRFGNTPLCGVLRIRLCSWRELLSRPDNHFSQKPGSI